MSGKKDIWDGLLEGTVIHGVDALRVEGWIPLLEIAEKNNLAPSSCQVKLKKEAEAGKYEAGKFRVMWNGQNRVIRFYRRLKG